MDIWHKITKFVDYNRWTVLFVVLAIALSIGLTSCEPKALGLAGEKKTLAEFDQEVIKHNEGVTREIIEWEAQGRMLEAKHVAFADQIESTYDEFQKEHERRKVIFETVGGMVASFVSGNPVTAAEAITTTLSILAVGGLIGTGVDIRRKGKKITQLKNGGAGT